MRLNFRRVVSGLFCAFSISIISVSSLLTAALLIALPQVAQAQTTHTVCPSGCDYTSPDIAVNSGSIADGDAINVQTGTYVLINTLQVSNSFLA